MLVYWDRKQRIKPREHLAAAAGGGALDLLIAAGEVEAGVADTRWPERDGDDQTSEALRRFTLNAARHFLYGEAKPGADPGIELPGQVEAGIPEGYAYYALFPETYASAAEKFVHRHGPCAVGVVGVRSIGTSLSAVVAAALERSGCRVRSWTVRPRGHPFDRRLALTPELAADWRAGGIDRWAIVDEGPGLSGSSMTSVAAQLAELGVPDERVALFPSWDTDGRRLLCEAARRRWPRHLRYLGDWKAPSFATGPGTIEISAGEWRTRVLAPGVPWPAANPLHERRKYLNGNGVLFTFEGLGRFGRSRLDRAERLWKAGFGPRPEGIENGFLASEWLAGRRATTADRNDLDFIQTLGRYLRFLSAEFPTEPGVPAEVLREMIRVNLGSEWKTAVPAGPACGLDGRLLPHEWIRTRAGWRKVDALHHHDGHFLPGPQPVEWDVAGAVVEFGLEPGAAPALCRMCGADAETLEFWITAYRAFRYGYCTMSAESLRGAAEEERFRSAARRYAVRRDGTSS